MDHSCVAAVKNMEITWKVFMGFVPSSWQVVLNQDDNEWVILWIDDVGGGFAAPEAKGSNSMDLLVPGFHSKDWTEPESGCRDL